MNKQELLKLLEKRDKNAPFLFKVAANVIRFQADRIAELEHMNKNWSISESLALQRIAELEKASSKPVAWIRNGDDQLSLVKEKDDGYMQWKPLYTHSHKELSDEEIETIMYKCDWSYDPVSFARAIIKASRGEE
jgi:hypothetical protein